MVFKFSYILFNEASEKNYFVTIALLVLRKLSSKDFLSNYGKIFFFYLVVISNVHANKTEQLYNFNVQQKTLSAALNSIVEQTGTLVLYPPKLAKENGSYSINGRYTINDALNRMLKNKKITASLTKRGVIVISQNKKNEALNMKKKIYYLKQKCPY